FWQVSAEPPLAFPPTAAFEFRTDPPVPDPLPPVAFPPLAFALPLVAAALLWSTDAVCVAETSTWTITGGLTASAAGTTTKAANAAEAPSSHRVFADPICCSFRAL